MLSMNSYVERNFLEKEMKKIYIVILLILSINTYAGSGLLVVKALGDTDSNGVQEYSIFSRDASTGTETLLKTFESPYGTCAGCSFVNSSINRFVPRCHIWK